MGKARLKNVQRGEAIRADNYNALVDGYNELNSIEPVQQPGYRRLAPSMVYLRNATDHTRVQTGSVMSITGWGNQSSAKKQRAQCMSQGIFLAGVLAARYQRYYPNAVAITLEAIAPGQYGLAWVPGGIAAAGVIAPQWPNRTTAAYARVVAGEDLSDEVVPAGLALADFGEFLIVAASLGGWPGADNCAWCAIVPVCDYGHFSGFLLDQLTQTPNREASARVSLYDASAGVNDHGAIAQCYCPTLPPGEIIAAGSVVLFQRNNISGRWEIFSVECPPQ